MIRLAVRCRPEQAEIVLAELAVLAPSGVEETAGDGFVEYAIYGAPGEIPDLGDIEVAAGDALVEVSSREIADDWAGRWQDFHKPVLVGERLWLRPPWGPAKDGALDVIVDPGQAFGTGAHPTTQLCLELLAERASEGEAGGPMTDLGTGSGVLAIAAAKLGWGPILGIDHEEAAVLAAAENAEANDVEIDLARVNLREERLPDLAPYVVANLTAPLLIPLAAELAEGIASGERTPPGTLICSGLLVTESDLVSEAFAEAGLREEERRGLGDWGALLLRVA